MNQRRTSAATTSSASGAPAGGWPSCGGGGGPGDGGGRPPGRPRGRPRASGRVRRWSVRVGLGAVAAGVLGGAALAWAWHRHPFPEERLGDWGRTRLVTAADGTPLLALVGRDEQWRSPVGLDGVSPRLVQATIAVEDRRFRSHSGVDPVAVARAAWQNLVSGRVVSGASTITMQVCRMMDDRPRTLPSKLVESFRALQLETIRNKDEILGHYLDVAPYGGNLRGVEAAARAWFGKPADRVSLAEAALLAGLPQSPERLRPDRHPEAARVRRRTVLDAMLAAGFIDEQARDAADAEPIVLAGRRLGFIGSDDEGRASHVAWMALERRPAGGRLLVEPGVQELVAGCVARHGTALPPGTDVAVVVIDVERASILALVGSADPGDPADGQVNGAIARRSPGSALKPFIYAAAIDAGRLAPDSLLPDAPIDRAGWRPDNFDRTFRGPVTAAEALRDSLNIPAILLAEELGLERCLGVMEACGLELPPDAAARGGLSLAVGGLEVRLLDLTDAFATLARGGIHRPARLFADEPAPDGRRVLAADTAAAVSDMLSSAHRLPETGDAVVGLGDAWLSWKTGTSSARRDAWAVGHNGRFAVGVWVGRFAGGGDVAYTGRASAEPLLAALLTHPRLARRAPATAPAPASPAVRRSVVRPLEISRVAERLPGAAADSADSADSTGSAATAEAAHRLHVTAPSDGSRFIAVGGAVVLRPAARLVDDVTGIATGTPPAVRWLLDGRPVPGGGAPRLELGPGRYVLTAIGGGRGGGDGDRDDDGVRSASVRFTVAPRP